MPVDTIDGSASAILHACVLPDGPMPPSNQSVASLIVRPLPTCNSGVPLVPARTEVTTTAPIPPPSSSIPPPATVPTTTPEAPPPPVEYSGQNLAHTKVTAASIAQRINPPTIAPEVPPLVSPPAALPTELSTDKDTQDAVGTHNEKAATAKKPGRGRKRKSDALTGDSDGIPATKKPTARAKKNANDKTSAPSHRGKKANETVGTTSSVDAAPKTRSGRAVKPPKHLLTTDGN